MNWPVFLLHLKTPWRERPWRRQCWADGCAGERYTGNVCGCWLDATLSSGLDPLVTNGSKASLLPLAPTEALKLLSNQAC